MFTLSGCWPASPLLFYWPVGYSRGQNSSTSNGSTPHSSNGSSYSGTASLHGYSNNTGALGGNMAGMHPNLYDTHNHLTTNDDDVKSESY